MFNIYRMLFLSLKKVWVVNITPCQIPTTRKINVAQVNFSFPLPLNAIWKTLDKGPSLFTFVCFFQVKFNFSIENVFLRVVLWHQKCIDLWSELESKAALKLWNSCASFYLDIYTLKKKWPILSSSLYCLLKTMELLNKCVICYFRYLKKRSEWWFI